MKIKILVCCHKKDFMITQTPYLPIQVGKSISSEELAMQGDNTGDNISSKNASYCELTGIYWAWKNLKGLDAIGVCHYRRYFDFHQQCRNYLPVDHFATTETKEIKYDLTRSVINELERGNIIMPQRNTIGTTLGVQYCLIHNSRDLKIMEDVITEFCEKKYLDAFHHIIYGNNKMHPFNMFIMPWEVFDRYCTWLFMILKEIENRIDITNYDSYQKRIYGFMSERLLNVFLYAEKIKTIEYPIIYVNDSKLKMGCIEYWGRNVLKNLNAFLYKLLYYYPSSGQE